MSGYSAISNDDRYPVNVRLRVEISSNQLIGTHQCCPDKQIAAFKHL